jgi:hypothetical protein
MIDFIIFDVYQQGKLGGRGALQADTDRRVANSEGKLRELEQRYERMSCKVPSSYRGVRAASLNR